MALAFLFSLLAAARGAETTEASPAKLIGFTDAHAAAQIAVEQKFDALLSAAEQKAWLEQMSAAPNHVGSPHNKANADFVAAKFAEWVVRGNHHDGWVLKSGG